MVLGNIYFEGAGSNFHIGDALVFEIALDTEGGVGCHICAAGLDDGQL